MIILDRMKRCLSGGIAGLAIAGASLLMLASCSNTIDPEDEDGEVFVSKGRILEPEAWIMWSHDPCDNRWVILIDGERYGALLPVYNGLDLRKERFPLDVRIKWRKIKNGFKCNNEFIAVLEISREPPYRIGEVFGVPELCCN